MAWGLFVETAHLLRVTPGGAVLGVDLDRAMRRLTAAGTDPDTAEIFLTSCERGLVRALSEAKESRDEQQD